VNNKINILNISRILLLQEGFLLFVFAISCVATRGYHGGTNIRGFGIGQPNGLTCGFNDGPLSGFAVYANHLQMSLL
jgi:hypothetical protein